MRIDCHTHTERHSNCSSLAPPRLCELALERGLDAVVITEHHYQWPKAQLDRLRGNFPALRVFSGMEVSVREGYDVVVIGTELDGLGQRFIPVRDLADAVAERRGDVFLFVAHPFRFSKRLGKKLERVLDTVDGIEMNSVNILQGNYQLRDGLYMPEDEDLYERALEGRDLVRLYNTDAHGSDAVGTIMSEFEGDAPDDEAALARMLKSQQPREVQNTALLETSLRRWMF